MIKKRIVITENDEAIVSKAFAKQARIYGTPEYKLWREFKRENPEAEMVTKTVRKSPDRKTNRNMTYNNMKTFIGEYLHDEKAVKEFERQIKLSQIQNSPYHYIVNWFKKNFPDYEKCEIFVTAKSEANDTGLKIAG